MHASQPRSSDLRELSFFGLRRFDRRCLRSGRCVSNDSGILAANPLRSLSHRHILAFKALSCSGERGHRWVEYPGRPAIVEPPGSGGHISQRRVVETLGVAMIFAECLLQRSNPTASVSVDTAGLPIRWLNRLSITAASANAAGGTEGMLIAFGRSPLRSANLRGRCYRGCSRTS